MESTATVLILPLFIGLIFLTRGASSVDCTCKKVKFETCQKDALFYNKEFISRYTPENAESFSVDLFQEPIIVATREQTKIIKKMYRSMFIYPEKKETIVTTQAPPVEQITQSQPEAVSRGDGLIIERNETCSNTTELEHFQDWIRITEYIQCNETVGPGQIRRTAQQSTRYIPNTERRRVRRQTFKLRLCQADYIPADRVLYTVTKSGETVQVVQVPGAHQDQGDISCTPAPSMPRNVFCELEMVDTPKVVFRLGKKTIDSQNIRVPRCTAFMRV